MSQIQTDKEKIIIKIDNYIITEKRLDEFLKKCWKYDGNKIKDILEKNIVLDIEEQTLFCEMTNKNKKKYKYQVSL